MEAIRIDGLPSSQRLLPHSESLFPAKAHRGCRELQTKEHSARLLEMALCMNQAIQVQQGIHILLAHHHHLFPGACHEDASTWCRSDQLHRR